MTVWTQDAPGRYKPDEEMTKVLDEQTEGWGTPTGASRAASTSPP